MKQAIRIFDSVPNVVRAEQEIELKNKSNSYEPGFFTNNFT